MRRLLITMTALMAVLAAGLFNGRHAPHAQEITAANPVFGASMRAYCAKSRVLLGHAYFPAHERSCRAARRLLV